MESQADLIVVGDGLVGTAMAWICPLSAAFSSKTFNARTNSRSQEVRPSSGGIIALIRNINCHYFTF